jgi:adenine deaminase
VVYEGKIVDIIHRRIYSGEITVTRGKIQKIKEKQNNAEHFILPGFIDAHIHIESSMLVPSEFAKIAVTHGTVATVSDPHEIANVLGLEGVEFMIENGRTVPFKFYFGAPSCVPATNFETAGAEISSDQIKTLLQRPEVKYLAEMMNYPGVIRGDEEILSKISWAKHFKKPVDGHAPGLGGADLDAYIAAGISTDHECFTYEEAKEKLKKGMKVLIREGSAAKNYNALIDLLPEYYNQLMFCSDDKHPDELLLGHINQLVARAVSKGMDIYKVLQVACLNPVVHYNLDVGTLGIGHTADFIVVEDLRSFKVLQTFINGELVSEQGKSHMKTSDFEILNNFETPAKTPDDFRIRAESDRLRVIECLDGELVTNEIFTKAKIQEGMIVSDVNRDIIKIAVVNRYRDEPPAIGFIKNMGLTEGAIASSVAHDSHNIVVVGVDEESMSEAVNLIIEKKGGISAVSSKRQKIMPLPVAGIMSAEDAQTVGLWYSELDAMAKSMGSSLSAPYMTLSFMALLVIPNLKLSDLGLFDGSSFCFTDLQTSKRT